MADNLVKLGRSMLRPYKYDSRLMVAAFGFCFVEDGYGSSEKVDEAFGVFGVVAAHGEASEVGAIEREGRFAAGYVERALPEFEADGAGDELLGDFEETVE